MLKYIKQITACVSGGLFSCKDRNLLIRTNAMYKNRVESKTVEFQAFGTDSFVWVAEHKFYI